MAHARRRHPPIFAAGLAAFFLILLFWPCHKPGAEEKTPDAFYTAAFVPDGDTIICTEGSHVRSIGINAPEMGKDAVPEEPFATKSREANQELCSRGPLRLYYDAEKADRYGRKLAYLLNADGVFVNKAMVEKGLAYVLPVPPNLARQGELLAAQQKAMEGRAGMWGAYAEKQKGPCVANLKSWRFHKPRHYKPGPGRPEFRTAWDAFFAGYAPCRECCPDWVRNFSMSDKMP